MAYLNVRERRLETTIAYVGATTNLACLEGAARVLEDDDALLALAWAPADAPRVDGCDVMVRLVAPRSDEQLFALLADADGVVVAADGGHALDMVRAHAAERPVLVQEGDGLVATLEAALASVIAAMKSRTTPVPAAADPNPLLSALREVLRETVREHAESMDRAMTTAIEAALAPVRAELVSLKNALTVSARESARALNAQGQAIDAHTQRLGDLATTMASTMAQLGRLESIEHGARDLAVKVGAIETGLREELATRSRQERDHMTSSSAVLRRAIEGIANDVRKSDRGAELGALAKRTEALESSVLRELREGMTPRITHVVDSVEAGRASSAEVLARTNETHAVVAELVDELKKRKKNWF